MKTAFHMIVQILQNSLFVQAVNMLGEYILPVEAAIIHCAILEGAGTSFAMITAPEALGKMLRSDVPFPPIFRTEAFQAAINCQRAHMLNGLSFDQ